MLIFLLLFGIASFCGEIGVVYSLQQRLRKGDDLESSFLCSASTIRQPRSVMRDCQQLVDAGSQPLMRVTLRRAQSAAGPDVFHVHTSYTSVQLDGLWS